MVFNFIIVLVVKQVSKMHFPKSKVINTSKFFQGKNHYNKVLNNKVISVYLKKS